MSSEPKQPVPVFPLPGVVLFPGVRLPLHVFELRYRALVRAALAGERLFALALLLPGWERDYHGSPGYHPLACLARIHHVTWLTDDGYDLEIEGLMRVRLGDPVREFPFRTARCCCLHQDPFSEDDAFVELERRAIAEVFARWESLDPPGGAPSDPIDECVGFEVMVNRLCQTLAVPAEERLGLLALDSVLERGRRVRLHLEERIRRAGRGGAAGGERN